MYVLNKALCRRRRHGNEIEISGRLVNEFERGLFKNNSSYSGMHFEYRQIHSCVRFV